MKSKPMPVPEYPGNEWLTARLDDWGVETSSPHVHGIIRGALANPMMVDPAEAMAEIFGETDPSSKGPEALEELSLALIHLWNDTAKAYQEAIPFPRAIMSKARRKDDPGPFLREVVALADGFRKGFSLGVVPPGFRLENANSWLREITREAKRCRNWYEHPQTLNAEFPGARDRAWVLRDALTWIEESMGWAALYARLDLDQASKTATGRGPGRNAPCPCGSGKKSKRCCLF